MLTGRGAMASPLSAAHRSRVTSSMKASKSRITLAFGLRYTADPAGLMRGLAAALVPGGTLVVLEAVTPRGGLVAAAARSYFFCAAPRVGTLLAGRSELYEQLTATVRTFGGAADLLGHVRVAGLAPRERRLFAGGTVAGIVAQPTRPFDD